IKYYGHGNDTKYDKDLDKSDYYQLNQELLSVNPSIKFPIVRNLYGIAGLSYNYSDISIRNDTLLNSFSGGKYGLNSFKLAGLHSALEFDSRDVSANPYNGIFMKFSGSYFPEIFDNNQSSFVKAGFDIRSYFTTD